MIRGHVTCARAICLAGMLLLPVPAAAHLAQGGDDGVSAWRVVGALLLCLVLAVAGAVVLKLRLGGGARLPRLTSANRRLKLVERLRLNPQTEIAIISCDDRDLLIATNAAGASLLSVLPDSGE